MENRAAVFTTHPQVVEVYQSGAWWPGQLLGWRHDPNGTCQVWVRVVLGGVEESAWTELTALRLPERHLAVAPEPSAEDAPVTREMSAIRVSSELDGDIGARDPFETASLPLIRNRSLAASRTSGGAPRSGGRRRAPDTGSFVAVVAAAAPSSAPAAAPSTAVDVPSPASTMAPVGGGPRGRHRAPADPGRHRAAETGLLPLVPAEADRALPSAPTGARREQSLPSPCEAGAGSLDMEPDLLTRPMRLTDLVPHSRRPRVDGSLAGV